MSTDDWLYWYALGRARAQLALERDAVGEADSASEREVGNGTAALAAQRQRLDFLDKQVEAGNIDEHDYLNQVNELRDNYNASLRRTG